MKEKPPVLSEEQRTEIARECWRTRYTYPELVAIRQRDADVEWFTLLRNRDADQCSQSIADSRQQAKTEVAREIFEELNKLIYENKEPSPPVAEMWLEDWQAFKSKYLSPK